MLRSWSRNPIYVEKNQWTCHYRIFQTFDRVRERFIMELNTTSALNKCYLLYSKWIFCTAYDLQVHCHVYFSGDLLSIVWLL